MHPEPFIRRPLSRGWIECIDREDRLLFGFTVQPIVRSYRSDGTLLWTAAIVDDCLQLQVMELRHPETGRIGFSERMESDHDRLQFIGAFGAGEHALLQYSRVFPRRREIVPQSYLIDTSTGLGAFVGDSLPNVVSTQPDGYIALFEYPTVSLEVRKFDDFGPLGGR